MLKQRNHFQPNDFSTMDLGLKDTKMNEAYRVYTIISLSPQNKSNQTKTTGNSKPNILPIRHWFTWIFSEVRSQAKLVHVFPFATTALRRILYAKDAGARGTDITYLSPSYIYYPSGPKDGMYFESAFQIFKTKKEYLQKTERLYDLNPENTTI